MYVRITHSEVVKGGVRQATSCNVFGQLVQHLRVLGLGQGPGTDYKSDKLIRELRGATHTHNPFVCTHMHGQYTAGDEFAVLSDAEVPRLYPHHVVKHELQVQASFYAHLQQRRGLGSVYRRRLQAALPPTDINQMVHL